MGVENIKVDSVSGMVSWVNGNVDLSFSSDVGSYALDDGRDIFIYSQ